MRKHFSCFYEKFTDAIEPIDIQNWQLALIRAGYSPNYVRVTQEMLSVAFDRAVILGITERNPSRMVGNVRGQKPLVDFWTLDEFEKVISKLYKGDYYEHYLFISLLFLFMSGMRLGEASALLWSDIDFTTGLCSITKTLYYHNQSDYKFTKPKTRAAIRSIYLDEDTLSELAAWRKVQRVVIPAACAEWPGFGAAPHFSNLRAYNERSRCPTGKPLAFPASGASRQRRRMHGSRSWSTFPFQMFPSIRLRIYERFVGGMVEGRIPLPGRGKGQRSQIGANGFI